MLEPTFGVVRIGKDDNLILTKLEGAERFFVGPGGTAALGDFIRMVTPAMGAEPVCLVLITEAYYLEVPKDQCETMEDAKKARGKGRLEHHPQSKECVMIKMYRPDVMRCGMLKILPGRLVEYMPLIEEQADLGGNLSLNPDGKK